MTLRFERAWKGRRASRPRRAEVDSQRGRPSSLLLLFFSLSTLKMLRPPLGWVAWGAHSDTSHAPMRLEMLVQKPVSAKPCEAVRSSAEAPAVMLLPFCRKTSTREDAGVPFSFSDWVLFAHLADGRKASDSHPLTANMITWRRRGAPASVLFLSFAASLAAAWAPGLPRRNCLRPKRASKRSESLTAAVDVAEVERFTVYGSDACHRSSCHSLLDLGSWRSRGAPRRFGYLHHLATATQTTDSFLPCIICVVPCSPGKLEKECPPCSPAPLERKG